MNLQDGDEEGRVVDGEAARVIEGLADQSLESSPWTTRGATVADLVTPWRPPDPPNPLLFLF